MCENIYPTIPEREKNNISIIDSALSITEYVALRTIEQGGGATVQNIVNENGTIDEKVITIEPYRRR